MESKTAIIGAGAAGVFCAALLREAGYRHGIEIFEAGRKPLAKVALTGGGRCNLTNSFDAVSDLSQVYPRGARLMKEQFRSFSNRDCMEWFRSHGVKLVTQEDNCVFPASQDAMEIVRTLLACLGGEKDRDRIPIRCSCPIKSIIPEAESGYTLLDAQGTRYHFDRVIVTPGGLPKQSTMLESLDIEIIESIPSLFTFTIRDGITDLMGTVVQAGVGISGTKFRATGPLLITDWGMSGPAILRLSSYAARHLHDNGYKAKLSVNWIQGSEEDARNMLTELGRDNGRKYLRSVHPGEIPSRLWSFLMDRCGIRDDMRWGELGRSGTNRICNTLVNDSYDILGRTRFREEFVTCGGVSLKSVRRDTLEARNHTGLYFAGEVLDVDAVTGGFNLQAAWTTAHAVASALLSK